MTLANAEPEGVLIAWSILSKAANMSELKVNFTDGLPVFYSFVLSGNKLGS